VRDGVELIAAVRDTYAFSTVRICAAAEHPFSLDVSPAHVYTTKRGFTEGSSLVHSAGADGLWEIDADITGVFAQLPVRAGEELRYGRGPGIERAEYGVRFYPFFSSVLKLRLAVSRGLRSVTVEDRAEVRLLWDRASQLRHDGSTEQLVRAHSPSGWRQTFRYSPAAPTVELTVPVVASRRFLFRVVVFPLVTFAGSLVAVFAAHVLLDSEAVVAALGASATLLLREAVQSERAHQANLGNALLGVEGLLVLAWAAGLTLLPTAVMIGIAVVLVAAGVSLVGLTGRFEYVGRLPWPLASTWARAATALERWRARRRSRVGISPFDHGGRR
jgi:hypothetical protein